MPRLRKDQRQRAVTLRLQGRTHEHVARALNVHLTTISRIWSRLRVIGSTSDRSSNGRARVTTPRKINRLGLPIRNSYRIAAETAIVTQETHNHQISRDTVRNRLRGHGIKAYRHCVGLPLTRPRR